MWYLEGCLLWMKPVFFRTLFVNSFWPCLPLQRVQTVFCFWLFLKYLTSRTVPHPVILLHWILNILSPISCMSAACLVSRMGHSFSIERLRKSWLSVFSPRLCKDQWYVEPLSVYLWRLRKWWKVCQSWYFSKVRRYRVVFIANNRTASCALFSVSLHAGCFCNWNHRWDFQQLV